MKRLDHFMSETLSRYYDSRDPLGAEGDFTTAPEISQLFGEIIGIWALQKWLEMGAPSCFNLIEIGPGRGTLMADLLRGTKHVSAFHKAVQIHLVETSKTLKDKQRTTLNNYNVSWHDHLQSVDNDIPAIIIANEFFDALPVRQFRYGQTGWQEHYINRDESVWISVTNPPAKNGLPKPSQNNIYEYSLEQDIYAKLISQYKGAALIIDYGYFKSTYGDSLQALYKHQSCKITQHIGEADLTTHIDFEWLSTFFQDFTVKTQSDFLQQNGIAIRYHQLNNPSLLSGYERLIHPNQMGQLFKVMEILL